MKLNKPVISISIIVIIIVDLIFFSFLCIGKKIENKEYVEELIYKFDIKKYVLDNDNIKHSIDNYKYSEDVFNYLDDFKVKLIKRNFVNNLFDEKEVLIDKKDVSDVLKNSVYEYEYYNKVDIYNYVSSDIDAFTNYFVSKFDKDFAKDFNDFKNFTSGIIYYIPLILAIALFTLLIVFEKKNGILISALALLVYSFFLYYFNKHFLEIGFSRVFKYFNNVDLQLDNMYVICFIISFVLLLIYIVFYLKRAARNIRVNSYYRR